jgi:osmoprotectant transport system substrate-binding protein
MSPAARRSCAAAVVAGTFLTACGVGSANVPTVNDPVRRSDPGALIVASFNFPESEVLAHVYADVLRSKGFPARVMENVGARELVEPALYRGLVDVVPEYAGSALAFLSLGADSGTAGALDTMSRLRAALRSRGLVALHPAQAQDANAIVVTRETAERLHLRDISDLRPVAGGMDFGGPPECAQRPFCLLGLRRTYGLSFRNVFEIDAGGPLTLDALLTGRVEVALLFTSDPAIEANHLVVLRDDLGLQPAENVVPVIRAAALQRYGPGVSDALDWVSGRLDTDALRELNGLVALAGDTPAQAAEEWLGRRGVEPSTGQVAS